MASAPDSSTSHDRLAARVLVDQADSLQRNVLPLMLGNYAIVLIMAWMFRDGAHPDWLLAWFVLQTLNVAFSLWAAWRLRKRPATERNAARRTRAATKASLVSGVLWGVGAVAFWPAGQFELQVLILFLITGLTANALSALSANLAAYRSFLLPCAIGIVIAALGHGGLLNLFVALTAVIYCAANWHFAQRINHTLLESLRRRYEVQELAADLQAQRDLAQEASLSKSRFLAAASHDLRQPVHSLSLFMGALGNQPMGDEARRIVGHLNGCVGSMSVMFNSLLDMSKLDAGMVQPDLQPLPLHLLLQQICAEEAAQAEVKGLRMRLRSRPLTVLGDVVLLDRILRNLVSNAVRYTERGGVLVALQRRGEVAVVSIIDSGIGIPPESRELVFQEFVQLHNPRRDSGKGLGLGLAIVRRLCNLLNLPLEMRSRPGHGTCFRLRIALTDEVPPEQLSRPVPLTAMASDRDPAGDLVLVIDDDDPVRAAMQTLLSGWGYQVISASGFDSLLPQLANVTQLPVLVLCDYQLANQENGLHVIDQIAEQFNETIPAILITGDTAPERLQQAHGSGLMLLHKPVSPRALRDAMRRAMASHETQLD